MSTSSDTPKTHSIRIEAGLGRAVVDVDGKDMSHIIRSYEIRHEAGDSMHLTMHVNVMDVTKINGEGTVTVLVGGQEFTWGDVDALLDTADLLSEHGHTALAFRLQGTADRIAALLPPREEP